MTVAASPWSHNQDSGTSQVVGIYRHHLSLGRVSAICVFHKWLPTHRVNGSKNTSCGNGMFLEQLWAICSAITAEVTREVCHSHVMFCLATASFSLELRVPVTVAKEDYLCVYVFQEKKSEVDTF